jgi:hypothetical protein
MHFRWQWIGVQMKNNVDKTMYVGIVYYNPLGVGYLCRVINFFPFDNWNLPWSL